MKSTLAIYGALLVLVLGVVGIVIAVGGISLPQTLPPRGETQIRAFAANKARIVQVGDIECEMLGDCESLGVRGPEGLTREQAGAREPNVRLVFDATDGSVTVVPIR